MSDPLGHAAVFTDLPPDIRLLNRIVQGVLIHAEWWPHMVSMPVTSRAHRDGHCPFPIG